MARKVKIKNGSHSEYADLDNRLGEIASHVVSDRFHLQSLFMTGDAGNYAVKHMQMGMPSTAQIFRNQVAYLTPRQYVELTERYATLAEFQARHPNTFLFSLVMRDPETGKPYAKKGGRNDNLLHVVVGDQAHLYGRVNHRFEEAKFDYDYAGAIAGAMMMNLFPASEYDATQRKNIVTSIAHPTRAYASRKLINAIYLGWHVVRLPEGDDTAYRITEVVPFDEPVGGLVQWSKSDFARMNPLDLREDDLIGLVDIGGNITSITTIRIGRDMQGRMMFNPIYDPQRSPTVEGGVNDVIQALRETMLDMDEFSNMHRNIDMLRPDRIIHDRFVHLSGQKMDLTDIVHMSEQYFLNSFESVYIDKMSSGQMFRAIICTGGGMTSYYNRLRDDILRFNPELVYTAHEMSHINLANMLGGDLLFRQFVAKEQGILD